MKQLASLSYTFIFDPSETWSRLSEFERDLASYLNTREMEATIISPLGIGGSGKIIFIQPKKPLAPPKPPSKPSGKNAGEAIRDKGKELTRRV